MSALAAGASNLIQSPFGGFAPFPNSIMIPFMATQSAVLGYNFGIGYEMGKRTIKSLDNDFFNKIRAGSTDTISVVSDGQEIKMQYNEYISFITKRHGHEQIAIFEAMIPNFMRLQDTIINQSVEIEVKKANRTPSAMVEIIKAFGGATASQVKTQLDIFPLTEKTFILASSPMLALLYIFAGGKDGFTNTGIKEPEPPPTIDSGFEHKQIVGHEQHPFHSEQEPPQEGPDRNQPGKEPEPTEIVGIQTLRWTIQYRDNISGIQSVPLTLTETHNKDEWIKIIKFWKNIVTNTKPQHVQYPYYNAYYKSLSNAIFNKYGVRI